MKKAIEIGAILLMVVGINACTVEPGEQFEESLDPNFIPDTTYVNLIDSSGFISFCGYKNNYFILDGTYHGDTSGYEYEWSSGQMIGEVVISEAGLYELNITHPDSEGVVLSKHVDLSFCPTVLYIPNSLTPNNDGMNDTWGPEGDGIDYITFKVYSTNDELLFESNDINVPWDGSKKGTPLQSGSYMYEVEGRYKSGVLFSYAGSVELFH